MKKIQKGKKPKNQISQDELLAAITGLEEIVTEEMPKGWGEEKGTEERLSQSFLALEKAKDNILQKLMENNGELTVEDLYGSVRMGSGTFNMALKCLENDQKIEIVKSTLK